MTGPYGRSALSISERAYCLNLREKVLSEDLRIGELLLHLLIFLWGWGGLVWCGCMDGYEDTNKRTLEGV